jgi:DMSO/TMAO reductase YedYZ heme-binding membrane subunit
LLVETVLCNRRAEERRRTCERAELKMKPETTKTLRAFLIELAIYAVLVVGYFFLVLHFLGEGLRQLEQNHRYAYAGAAILLMIGQAVLLQNVTTLLLRMIRGRSE